MNVASRRISRSHLPPLMAFEDVVVHGHRGRTNPGALWPEFDRQYHARHLHSRRPVCTPPPADVAPVETVAEPCVFAGVLDLHFGHFVSEAVPRLPQILAERPDATLVFTVWRDMTHAEISAGPGAILNWLGIGWDRVRLNHRPTRFLRLETAAQGEHLGGPSPSDDYLRLVEALARVRLGRPAQPSGLTYVSRSKLPPQLAHFGGEAHLDSCLTRLGCRVIHPETLPLAAQLEAYATAQHLVFAEGSAVHGRQLLGRCDQHLSVLVLRPGVFLASHELLPRAMSLEYVPAAHQTLTFLDADGQPHPHSVISVFDLTELFGFFAAQGYDLEGVWDTAIYEQARDQDILRWIAGLYTTKSEPWLRPHKSLPHFEAQLDRMGLGHLIAETRRIVGHYEGTA